MRIYALYNCCQREAENLEDSIFAALGKYSPKENQKPEENYLTELFAWLLRNIDGYALEYVRLLNKVLNDQSRQKLQLLNDQGDEPDEINTQWTLQSGKRPDLKIVVKRRNRKDLCFVCEHKINAGLHPDQMKTYKDDEYLSEYEHYAVLVTLSKNQWTQKENTDISLLWSDIYKMTVIFNDSGTIEEGSFAKEILQHFLAYMEEKGMGSLSAIDVDGLAFYWSGVHFLPTISGIFGELASLPWDEVVPEIAGCSFSESGYSPESKKRWGRIGIDFFGNDPEKWVNGEKWANGFEPWRPGLFAGIIYDCKDHRIEPLNPAMGPDFVILLEAPYKKGSANEWYKSFKDSERYKNICSRIENNRDGFDYIDGDTLYKLSPWRVACLRKPLMEVLKGTSAYEEQVEAIKQTIIAGLRIYVG